MADNDRRPVYTLYVFKKGDRVVYAGWGGVPPDPPLDWDTLTRIPVVPPGQLPTWRTFTQVRKAGAPAPPAFGSPPSGATLRARPGAAQPVRAPSRWPGRKRRPRRKPRVPAVTEAQPADVFTAWRRAQVARLADQRLPAAEIAYRLGVSRRLVEQDLAEVAHGR